jgi:zinc/manganese transport system substrate-binding protein
VTDALLPLAPLAIRIALILRVLILVVVVAVLPACASGPPARGAGAGRVAVVAAEDTWGSIARQLGGRHAGVISVIANPNVDPHDYEPVPQDGVTVAEAQLLIVNGLGYDSWASKLAAASPSRSRIVLDVGRVLGLHDGDNPHQWYSPGAVRRVVDELTDDLKQLDPADAAAFDAQRESYLHQGLDRYDALRSEIRTKYAGTPVGASESIFAPLATDLGLDLETPASFLDAIAEGNEPTPKDKATLDTQLSEGQVKVFVYNEQNTTPDVRALLGRARAARIPTVSITETISPKGTTFEDWQSAQLDALEQALASATSA